MDRIIGRLENKLYGRSPTLESEAKQAVIERVLEDSYKRKQRLEDLDLKKPDVGKPADRSVKPHALVSSMWPIMA